MLYEVKAVGLFAQSLKWETPASAQGLYQGGRGNRDGRQGGLATQGFAMLGVDGVAARNSSQGSRRSANGGVQTTPVQQQNVR